MLKKQFKKKRYKITVSVIIAIAFVIIFIYNILSCKNVNSAQAFLDKSYISYKGGNDASIFFEEYVDIQEFKNVSFKYSNLPRLLTIQKHHTSFAVDVQYEKEKFFSVMENLLPSTDNPDPTQRSNYEGDFLITTVTEKEDIYINNYCGIFFNKEDYIVRYVFLYKFDVLQYGNDIRQILMRNTDLNWESTKKTENKEEENTEDSSFASQSQEEREQEDRQEKQGDGSLVPFFLKTQGDGSRRDKGTVLLSPFS